MILLEALYVKGHLGLHATPYYPPNESEVEHRRHWVAGRLVALGMTFNPNDNTVCIQDYTNEDLVLWDLANQ